MVRTFRSLLACVLLAAPVCSGADKTADQLLEVLRELGGLQDQLKTLQKSLEGRLADLSQSNADQARAAVEQAGKATAALGDRITKGLQDQQDQQSKTLAAVAGLSSQMQSLSGDFGTMRQAMNDLTASLAQLSTQIGDLGSTVKTALAPKPDTGSVATAPPISASDLFSAAEGDRLSGKFDLALQEYTGFVTQFGTGAQAPDAQYYIGSIHYSKNEWDEAVKAFDLVLTNYPDSRRVPEALYYKGDSLARLGRGPEADATLKDLRKRFPSSPLAKQSLSIKTTGK
jgi:tol-pal system protein YbgF